MKLEIKKDIYEEIHELLSKARQNIISNINSTMTKTYFLIGKRILEEEQNGNKRAEYGKNLIKTLSKKLKRTSRGVLARIYELRKKGIDIELKKHEINKKFVEDCFIKNGG